MKSRSNYVFGAALAAASMGGVPGLVNRAQAAPVAAAAFTFETSGVAFSTSVTQGATPFGPVVAESGAGSAFGSHAATAAVYSSPSGNGSAHSFSANDLSAGDYYKFAVPTTGLQNILFFVRPDFQQHRPEGFQHFLQHGRNEFLGIGQHIYTQLDPNGERNRHRHDDRHGIHLEPGLQRRLQSGLRSVGNYRVEQ